MTAVRRGDWASFDLLVLRHQATAWRVAYRLLGDRAEAEDVAQHAFLRILEASPRYEPSARFTTYLHQVVTRLCFDRIRRKRPTPLDSALEVADSKTPLELDLSGEREAAVRRCLDALPPAQRTAIVLRHFEGSSYREIAAAMETTEKAVERLLARAREALEPMLAGLLET